MAFLVIFGIGGLALLVTLGTWQTQRLAWKNDLIAQLETRLAQPPIYVTGGETQNTHNYRRAVAEGRYVADAQPARFLTSLKPFGPGHRVIYPFALSSGDKILVDRGYVRQGDPIPPAPEGFAQLTGALHWPRESNSFTPDANIAERRWFSREVDEVADVLETAPVMLVLDANATRSPIALPVTVDLPNNHLGYAITWFSLAAIWLVMTVILTRRGFRLSA